MPTADRSALWCTVLAAALATATTGCAASVILENPTTKQRVNCTAEAIRLSQMVPPSESTGKDVPRYEPVSPPIARFDYERQCLGNLRREGFVCVSGC
jgi:hypothetical protein